MLLRLLTKESPQSYLTEPSTPRMRAGKGNRSSIVPVRRKLRAAFGSARPYGSITQGRLVNVHPSAAWHWVGAAIRTG